jgi:hypothetical protein
VRPEAAVSAYGSLSENVWPLVAVNGVALPIVLPLAPRNEMLPVHEAAVPAARAEAGLFTS